MSEELENFTAKNITSNIIVSNDGVFNYVKSNGVILSGGDIMSDSTVKAGIMVVAPTIKTNTMRKTMELLVLQENIVLTADLITKNKILIPAYTGDVILSLDTSSNYVYCILNNSIWTLLDSKEFIFQSNVLYIKVASSTRGIVVYVSGSFKSNGGSDTCVR